jgi:hypothetical protein
MQLYLKSAQIRAIPSLGKEEEGVNKAVKPLPAPPTGGNRTIRIKVSFKPQLELFRKLH